MNCLLVILSLNLFNKQMVSNIKNTNSLICTQLNSLKYCNSYLLGHSEMVSSIDND